MKILYGRLIDSVSDAPIESGMLAIDGDTIAYAGVRGGFPVPEDAEIWEIENGTILPGFIDAHAHFAGSESVNKSGDTPYDLLLTAACDLSDLVDAGFTGAREMSAFGRPLRDAVNKGSLKGPRIMVGGKVLSISSGHCDFEPNLSIEESNEKSIISYIMDGPEACLRGVREQFRAGAEFIKICATGGVSSAIDDYNDQEFSEEELTVIIGEAKRHNTYVAAHCTGTAGTKAALKAGIGCVEHGVMLDEECCEIMRQNGVPLVTTLSVSLGLSDMKGLPEFMMEKARGIRGCSMRSFQLAHEYGIMVALGTDYSNSPNTPFSEIGKEFYSLTRCGYTPMEAIKAGTINGATLMKRADKVGTLEKGKLADVVLVAGDPISDIKLLADSKNVKLVFIGGKIQKDTTGGRI